MWIGINSTILKGVHIGEGAIRNPPHSLMAGVPARVIKSDVDWMSNDTR